MSAPTLHHGRILSANERKLRFGRKSAAAGRPEDDYDEDDEMMRHSEEKGSFPADPGAEEPRLDLDISEDDLDDGGYAVRLNKEGKVEEVDMSSPEWKNLMDQVRVPRFRHLLPRHDKQLSSLRIADETRRHGGNRSRAIGGAFFRPLHAQNEETWCSAVLANSVLRRQIRKQIIAAVKEMERDKVKQKTIKVKRDGRKGSGVGRLDK